MHIEKRKIGTKTKYYLAHSFRQNGKVRKIRIYLGADLSRSEVLDKRKNAEKEIRNRIKAARIIHDPYKTVLIQREIEELKNLISKDEVKIVHLSEEDWLKFTELFTYDTNAIEGSTVTEKEVEGILEKNKWPEKTKEEISETYGVAEAVAHIRKTRDHLSIELIKKLHKIVFRNSKSFAGKFRKKGEEVVIMDAFGNIVHRGAPSSQVTSLLNELVSWYLKNRYKYHPIVLAAVVHNQFENIHPFADGNGRVGRLLLVNVLLKHNLPPLNIELKNRKEYYEALQAYENQQNIRPTIKLMLKEYRKLKRVLKK
jgi:Fic family protein